MNFSFTKELYIYAYVSWKREELQEIEETDDKLISYNKAISIIRCIFQLTVTNFILEQFIQRCTL